MRRYIAKRVGAMPHVSVEENGIKRPLDPRLDLCNHSPDGFEWGYGGSGPSQLALAICADALGDDRLACRVYQTFKQEVIVNQDKAGFELRADDVLRSIERLTGLTP